MFKTEIISLDSAFNEDMVLRGNPTFSTFSGNSLPAYLGISKNRVTATKMTIAIKRVHTNNLINKNSIPSPPIGGK